MYKRLIFLAAILVYFAYAPSLYAGFGITPPYVRSDRLTQGSTFTQEIIIVRGDPVEDLKAEITVNVPGIEGWITIDRGNEFLLPAGVRQVPMQVTIRVPQNASYERHQGTIRIRTVSPSPTSGVSIALGAQIDVDVRVVDEIRDFEVKRVQLSETEEPKRFWWLEFPGKIRFTMAIENTGNAPTAPSKVQFDIYDRRGNVVLETAYNTNKIEPILPFETREVHANMPTRLPPGSYLVRYSIFRFENEVKRSGELTLSVLPTGTLLMYEGYGFEGLSRGDRLSIIIPTVSLSIIIILGTAILIVRRKNIKRRKVHEQRRGRVTNQHAEHHHDDYRDPPYPRPPRGPQPRRTVPHGGGGGVVDLSRKVR